MLRHFRRHLGLLAGMLIAAIALGIAYRYVFNTIEERTLSYYARSSLHATGMALAGWTVQMAFAALPRSRFGRVLRGMPLIAEFALKALAMTAVLTIVTLGLQFALYPSTSHEWFARDLPRILTLAFAVSLLFSAIFEFRRLIGGRVLGSFFLGTYRRPRLEQRIVMFLDIAGSTALVEELGEVRVHDLITRFFFDIDAPRDDHAARPPGPCRGACDRARRDAPGASCRWSRGMNVFDRLDALPALSPEERQLLDSVKALARDEIAPRAADYDRTAEFPWNNIRAINALGLNAMFVPEAYGGAGLSYAAYLACVREISAACASTGIIWATNFHAAKPLI